MRACRPLFLFFRVDRAWKIKNSSIISKPVHYLQECSFHHGLNNKLTICGVKERKSVMDRKRRKSINPVWRPVCTPSASTLGTKLQDDREVEGANCKISSKASSNRYAHEDNEAANVPDDSTFSSRTFQDNGEGEAPEGGSEPSNQKLSISLEVGASLMRFIKGKGGSTQKNIEEEMGVKLIFPSSKWEDAIIIEGISAERVSKASERLQVIVEEAVKSPNLDYSHFISLPLAIHPELVDKLVSFQKYILGNEDDNLDSDSHGDTSEDEYKDQEIERAPDVAVKVKVEDDNEDITNIHRVSYTPKALKPKASKSPTASDLGIEKSIFIKPKTFHLTVLMLKLWNKDRVDAAAKVLQSVSSNVLVALDNKPVSVRLMGLECMRGSMAKAQVVYALVQEIGSEGRLLLACQVIIEAFVEAGLVLEKDARQKLKLHATVMNARHRKWKKRTRKLDSFDARGIFRQFGSEDWGEYHIREAHLSQRFVFDENGYYHCCASIPFPESMQLG